MQYTRILIAGAALCATLFFTGCAFVPQNISFNHNLSIQGGKLGEGKTLGLSVKDERAETAIGHRGTAYGAAASITTSDRLEEVIRDKMAGGLRQLGYTIEPNAEKQLSVELRLLSYGTSTGFWTGGIETKGSVKVLISSGKDKFDKNYHVENEERVMVVPTAEHNAELINKVLDDVLIKVLADEDFRAFIAR